MPKLAGHHLKVVSDKKINRSRGRNGGLFSEAGRKGATIDASQKAWWLVKRFQRRIGTSSEDWGGGG